MLNKLKFSIINKIKEYRLKNSNRSKLIRSYVQGNVISDGFPIILNIEPTNYCNLNCIMCPRNKMKRKVGMMDFKLFEKIIKESAGNVEFIWLHLFGESLFHKDIFKMIDFAKKKDIKVGLSTNATLLTEVNSRNLLDSNLDILILSLDNPNREIYNRVRVGGNFERVEENIAFFLNELNNAKFKPKIILQMIDLDSTRVFQNIFREKFSGYANTYIKIKEFSNWAGQVDSLVKENKVPNFKARCFEPWRALTIYWDGTVVPCCYDFDGSFVLGNIRHVSIKYLWNSNNMRKLRRSFQKEKARIKLCELCPTDDLTYEKCRNIPSPFYPFEHEINFYCK